MLKSWREGSLFYCTKSFWRQKTKVPGLSYGVICVILGLATLVKLRLVMDGQTNEQTYGHMMTAYT